MEVIHRFNSEERQHYLLEKHYAFKLKPRLLYAGYLDKLGGWKEEPHSHSFLEIVFVTDGSGTVMIDGKEYPVQRGDLLVYNADVVHFEKSSLTDPMEIRFVAFDKLEITDLPPNWLLPLSYGYVFPCGEMYATFHLYFSLLITEFEKKERFYMEIAQNISRTLLMYLFRLINRTKNASALFDSSKMIETALSYIDRHYSGKIRLDDLAEECYTNKYYLSHLFTRVQGISIGKYILNKRLRESESLLQSSDLSVTEIATKCGFPDPNYYCRVFKKERGISPSAYRKKSRARKK